MNTYDFLFKICLLGDSNVGKTALASKYVDDNYKKHIPPTIAMDFYIKTVEIFDKIIKLQIWDLSGNDEFKYIIETYCRNSQGILLIFDLNNRISFENLEKWLKYIKNNTDHDFPIILVGNKLDLERNIKYEECLEFALENNLEYMEISVKDNININEVFNNIIHNIKINRKYCLKYLNNYEEKENTIKLSRTNWFTCCHNCY
jgi:Ras-related protein Rab-1A